MPEAIKTAITETAAAPAEFESDGQRYKAQRLADLITADRYLEAKAVQAAGKGFGGVTFRKFVPPGTVG